MKYLLIGVLLLFPVSVCAFNMYDGCVVTDVIDGDTYKLQCIERKAIVFRVKDFDTFETRKIKRAYEQAKKFNISIDKVIELGKVSKIAVQSILQGKCVVIKLDSENPRGYYHRYLGDIFYADEGKWINVKEKFNFYNLLTK